MFRDALSGYVDLLEQYNKDMFRDALSGYVDLLEQYNKDMFRDALSGYLQADRQVPQQPSRHHTRATRACMGHFATRVVRHGGTLSSLPLWHLVESTSCMLHESILHERYVPTTSEVCADAGHLCNKCGNHCGMSR